MNIFLQDGKFINVLHPSTVAKTAIFSEDERKAIVQMIRHNFYPHHTSVGKGHSTRKHWNLEKYRGRFGKGFKLITTSPYSSNFNHITYFLKY